MLEGLTDEYLQIKDSVEAGDDFTLGRAVIAMLNIELCETGLREKLRGVSLLW